ncbi:hypothetical protein [Bremerella alba]|uniref:Sulfotransferase n=1 Tax=Bremerella alba TaxID=980252 RepID=A0A7V9A9D6_9BACT|nr:hypothetical protein [Bremerella alba]MBA2117410.1 hypothetical protein [Bremerella alba]
MIDVIHIGMHKAASTYFQDIGLSSHPEIETVTWNKNPEARELMWNIHLGSNGFCRQELVNYFNGIRDKTVSGKKVIWSFEGLSGAMYSGANSQYIVDILGQSFPETKILVVLREQYSFLDSVWCQYIREGGVLSRKEFLIKGSSPVINGSTGLSSPYAHGLYQRLFYDKYVEHLFNVFGQDRVHVFFFEEFCNNSVGFMQQLYGQIGVDSSFVPETTVRVPTGQKVNPAQASCLKLFNRICSTLHHQPLLPIPGLSTYSFPRRVFISMLNAVVRWKSSTVLSSVPQEVQEAIRYSNQNLGKMLDRDLSGLGYDCS